MHFLFCLLFEIYCNLVHLRCKNQRFCTSFKSVHCTTSVVKKHAMISKKIAIISRTPCALKSMGHIMINYYDRWSCIKDAQELILHQRCTGVFAVHHDQFYWSHVLLASLKSFLKSSISLVLLAFLKSIAICTSKGCNDCTDLTWPTPHHFISSLHLLCIFCAPSGQAQHSKKAQPSFLHFQCTTIATITTFGCTGCTGCTSGIASNNYVSHLIICYCIIVFGSYLI